MQRILKAATSPTIKTSLTSTATATRSMATITETRSMLPHATIIPRLSKDRGHADHGWLNSYHTFSFASYYAPEFQDFGSLRVLNEDRVAPSSGFPTHPHRDFEIFSYVLSGELTHRDSVHGHGDKGAGKDDYFVMKRNDVQFTTGGTGIAHSEFNENKSETVHFLQIWAKPWARGLPPTYHTKTFSEEDKRNGFVNILSPLVGGPKATKEQEKAAEPSVEGTIPIHADFMMGASIIPQGKAHEWVVGGQGGKVAKTKGRNVYVHLAMTQGGKAKVVLDGRDNVALNEGDGAFVKNVNGGDVLSFQSVGNAEAEVVVLDSD